MYAKENMEVDESTESSESTEMSKKVLNGDDYG
jgi:hypothetical protein